MFMNRFKRGIEPRPIINPSETNLVACYAVRKIRHLFAVPFAILERNRHIPSHFWFGKYVREVRDQSEAPTVGH